MTSQISCPRDLSDRDLLTEVECAARCERRATAKLIALLAEVDSRKLYAPQGCSSLFTYCVQVLHLSEHAAYLRIEAARAARRFPAIFDKLSEGSLHLTAVSLLAPHLTDANHGELLESARHKSKRDVEQLIARLRPQPDVPAVVRKWPAPTSRLVSETVAEPASQAALSTPIVAAPAPARPAEIRALAPERYKVQFTVSRETYEKLRSAQDLLRHTLPTGDPSAIFDRALTLLLADLSKAKCGATARSQQRPSTHSHSQRARRRSGKRAHASARDSNSVWTEFCHIAELPQATSSRVIARGSLPNAAAAM